MSTKLVDDTKLTAIGNAIRTKGGTQALLTLDEMPQAIDDLPSGGGGFDWSQLQGITIQQHDTSNPITALDLTGMDTSGFLTFYNMFGNLTHLASLDVSTVDLTSAKALNYMFYYCQALTSLDLRTFDTSNVTNMSNMFRNCSALESIYFPKFDSTHLTVSSSVTDMYKSDNALAALILATDKTTVQQIPNSFYSMGLPTSTIVYVPDALVSDYKAATNYSYIEDRIKGVSELPQKYKTLYGLS